MSRPMPFPVTQSAMLLTFTLLASGAAFAQPSAPDSAPSSEVTSGQRVIGQTHTHKSRYVKTSPEQPAPATRQRVQPSQRLPDEPNQNKEQVAPTPDAPVAPGTPVTPGHDVPTPRQD